MYTRGCKPCAPDKKIRRSHMKKYLALTMAACMALSLAACGSSASSTTSSSAAASTEATSDSAATAEATGSDNITGIAQCCDVGTLDDESFNQGCWEAVKGYGDENGIEYNYYLPSGEDASDEDRETLIRQAVSEGANTIVCVGYLYGPALAWAATEYPDVHFIAVDVNGFDINSENGTIPENVFCVTFKEEEAGYLAGYAAVKDGFTKLGFLGGMAVPAVIRYGYGYVQGADAAAQELGTNVQMNYYYGGQFYGDEKITAKMDGWYDGGTEVVFACGGGIWTSAAEAADKHDGKLIGVDVDQAGVIANYAGVDGLTVTSAMKGLYPATFDTLTDVIMNGNWDKYKGKIDNLGLVSADDPTLNYVQIPMESTQWKDGAFTKDDYKAMVKDMFDGKITVSNDTTKAAKDFATVITVDDQGKIKG